MITISSLTNFKYEKDDVNALYRTKLQLLMNNFMLHSLPSRRWRHGRLELDFN